MSKINKTPDFLKMGKQLIADIRIVAEKEGVDFFKSSFDNEGWTDGGFEKWQKRTDTINYKILSKTGYLKNSIQVFNSSNEQIVFGSDAEYAEIHNNGGTVTIPITAKSRKYFWFMFKATGVERWKWMALSKKESMSFVMPKRQFIGESQSFINYLDEELKELINSRFKQLKNTI